MGCVMTKMNLIGGLSAICITLAGCVSAPSEDLQVKASVLSASCKDMFLAGPADCRANPSFCSSYNGVPNVLSYQDAAQGAQNAVFAVVEYENGEVATCNWTAAGFLRGWDYVENRALATCERSRMTLIDKTGRALKPCRIFARDNEVL